MSNVWWLVLINEETTQQNGEKFTELAPFLVLFCLSAFISSNLHLMALQNADKTIVTIISKN